MDLWQGRIDASQSEYFHQIVRPIDLSHAIPKVNRKIALLGFASDAGVVRNQGRKGAADGPRFLKAALAKLPVQCAVELYDAGEIECRGDALETAQTALFEGVAKLLSAGYFPLLLGGGHETAWGHYQGIYQHYKTAIPILNFDAHFDLRADEKRTSGTSFYQIAKLSEKQGEPFDYSCIGIQKYGNTRALFERAKQLGVSSLLAEEIHILGEERVSDFTRKFLERIERGYLTFCLDVLSSAFAPGVSAPQPLGLTPWQLLPSLKLLASSGKLVGFDLVEYAPGFDEDGRTAKLGALMLSEFIHEFQ
jgi:formiminoglutamase